ncbi:hypothetical protein QOT17_017226 [Balamuthia mandrillaris]
MRSGFHSVGTWATAFTFDKRKYQTAISYFFTHRMTKKHQQNNSIAKKNNVSNTTGDVWEEGITELSKLLHVEMDVEGQVEADEGCTLLCCYCFFHRINPQNHEHRGVITLANIDYSQEEAAKHKRLLCMCSSTLDANKVIDELFIPDLQRSEEGEEEMWIKEYRRKERVIGSLFALYGDHIGQIEVTGIIGVGGDRCSKYSLVRSEDFKVLQWPKRCTLEHYPGLRTEALYQKQRDILASAKSKSQKKKDLSNIGMSERLSCLWKLKWFAPTFFDRIAFCRMHWIPLRLVKRLLLYFVRLEGSEFYRKVNNAVATYPVFPGLHDLPKIYHPSSANVLRILGTSGPMSSFLQMSPVIFYGLFTKPARYKLWCLLAKYDNLLVSRHYTPEALQTLQTDGQEIRWLMVETFAEVPGLVDLNKHKKDSSDSDDEVKQEFSLRFPYFELFEHAPRVLSMVGSGDTSTWEQQNKLYRKWAHSGNGKHTAAWAHINAQLALITKEEQQTKEANHNHIHYCSVGGQSKTVEPSPAVVTAFCEWYDLDIDYVKSLKIQQVDSRLIKKLFFLEHVNCVMYKSNMVFYNHFIRHNPNLQQQQQQQQH